MTAFELTSILRDYFQGERFAGMAVAAVGVAALAFALWMWRVHTGGFMWGMVIPLGIIGLGALGGGAFLAIKTGPQVEALERGLATKPEATVHEELTRMEKVNANWPILKYTWAGIILACLLVVLVVPGDALKGVALVLLLAASLAMTTDVLAERRAIVYTDALRAAAPR